MAASNNTLRIGVIAEEINDVEVLYELTCKIIAENTFSFRRFIGHGCGKVRRKCAAWSANLMARGCTHLVVLHDLDRHNEEELRKQLETSIAQQNFKGKLVLIPIEELEAWLLSDPIAIKKSFNMQKVPKIRKNVESIPSPKEYLAKIVDRNSKTTYLNTIHNKRIARNVKLTSVKRCGSFKPYPKFILQAAKNGT